MTKGSGLSGDLASLVEGGQEWGGVSEEQWELLEVNWPVDWCKGRQDRVYNHIDSHSQTKPLSALRAHCVEGDQSFLFHIQHTASCLFSRPEARKTNI